MRPLPSLNGCSNSNWAWSTKPGLQGLHEVNDRLFRYDWADFGRTSPNPRCLSTCWGSTRFSVWLRSRLITRSAGSRRWSRIFLRQMFSRAIFQQGFDFRGRMGRVYSFRVRVACRVSPPPPRLLGLQCFTGRVSCEIRSCSIS